MKTITHGSKNSYDRHGCRCDQCKVAKSEYNRRWYEANVEKRREAFRHWREANPDKCRERDALRRTARKAECLALLGGVCVVCGTTERLEFDHIDPGEKCFDITPHIRFSWDRLMPELLKCQLLCNPCHKAKTYKKET